MSKADPFLQKWWAREPEMELAQVFCAPTGRRLFSCWGALLFELDSAISDPSDRSVAQAKLAWWSDELARGGQGGSTHPLLRELFRQEDARRIEPLLWKHVGHAAMRLASDERTPLDVADSIASQRNYAIALAQVESSLFGIPSPPDSLAIGQLLRRLPARPDADAMARVRWPLQLLARHQVGPPGSMPAEGLSASTRALLSDYAAALLEALERERGGPLFRRCRRALDAWRLRQCAAGRPEMRSPGRFGTLWLLWRAARSGTQVSADAP